MNLKDEIKRLGGHDWGFPRKFSGVSGEGVEIWDFEIRHYNHFLDNVNSLEELIEGLNCLTPLADDALSTARGMNQMDFCDFKISLAHERRIAKEGGESKMPQRYHALVIPEKFLMSQEVSIGFNIPLGTALYRIGRLGYFHELNRQTKLK